MEGACGLDGGERRSGFIAGSPARLSRVSCAGAMLARMSSDGKRWESPKTAHGVDLCYKPPADGNMARGSLARVVYEIG